MKKYVSLLPALLLLPVAAMAQSVFVGTWKQQLSKGTQLPEKPFEFEVVGGQYNCKTCVPPYSIAADGQDHPVSGHPYYDTVAVKVVDASTIVETDKKGGKTVTTATLKVAADGKTLTYEASDSSASSGAPMTYSIEDTRVTKGPAGSHAVSGSWRAVKVLSASDNALLVTYALAGSTLKMSNPLGQSYAAPLDGTDAPYVGDPGQTSVSMKKIDDHTIDETDKRDGKVIGTARLRVSADGKTMTVAWKDLLRGSSGSVSYVKQ